MGSAGRSAGRVPVRGWLPLLPREAWGPGFSSFPTTASPERALYDFISYFNENSGVSSFNESAPPSLTGSRCCSPSRGLRSLLPSHVGEPGREGRSPRVPGRGAPSLPLPRRGPCSTGSEPGRDGKVSLQILPGRASGHSAPPRKSVACSLPWKLGAKEKAKD